MRNNLLAIILLSLSLSLFANPKELLKIYNVIKYVESNNKPKAIGDNGKAYGVVQIHKVCIDDINRIYGTDYTHLDAFDEVCSEEMFILYLSAGIERFKRIYKKYPREQDIVRMWNGSIYKGYRIRSTLRYWAQYERLKIKN